MGDDRISRVGHAVSRDGVNFQIDPEPLIIPQKEWESHGCEDPRMVKDGDTFLITYVAFDGRTPRQAITSTRNFQTLGERRLVFPERSINSRWGARELRTQAIPGFDPSTWKSEDAYWSKAGALFPEKINGRYCMLVGDDGLYFAESKDLRSWKIGDEPIVTNRAGYYDGGYVENGPPPIKTEEGWLVIYHGIQRFMDAPSDMRIYRLGAVMLDYENPTKVRWRTTKPILEPQERYERIGYIDIMEGMFEAHKNTSVIQLERLADSGNLPMAVFCCGAVETEKEKYNLYYAAADTVICLARTSLEEIKQIGEINSY